MQTTNNKTLEIKGMNGADCVQKVTGALNGVVGVNTQSVSVGSASITCDGQAKLDEACAAIKTAGFKARELGSNKPAGTESANGAAAAKCTGAATDGAFVASTVKATPIPSIPAHAATNGVIAPAATVAVTPSVPVALSPA